MADEAKQEGSAQDPMQNLKGEFNRKFEGMEKTISKLAESNQALLTQLSKITQPPKALAQDAGKKKISDVWYDAPEEAANTIKQEAKKEFWDEFKQYESKAAERNSAISALYIDYPELADMTNPLTKRALEIYNSLSESEKASNLSYKLAVRDAAAELSIAPASKRKKQNEEEEFVGGGSGSNGGSEGRRGKKSDELPLETLDFARMVGLDVDDPKVMESLKESNKRQGGAWLKYQPVQRGKKK